MSEVLKKFLEEKLDSAFSASAPQYQYYCGNCSLDAKMSLLQLSQHYRICAPFAALNCKTKKGLL